MTTHELAKLLLEQPNVPVFNYVQEAEEYGKTDSVKYYGVDEDLPYSKTDTPENKLGIVLIEGWCI